MIDQIRESVVNEFERVIICREIDRQGWKRHPVEYESRAEELRFKKLCQYNQAAVACKTALVHNSGDLMLKALKLCERIL